MPNTSQNVIVTKASDGSLRIAAWNLVDPGQHGPARTLQFTFRGVSPRVHVTMQRVDEEHGNVLKQYAAMGSPQYPTPPQVEQLNRETVLSPAQQLQLKNGELELSVRENALILLKVEE